jgi:hypothetical protein
VLSHARGVRLRRLRTTKHEHPSDVRLSRPSSFESVITISLTCSFCAPPCPTTVSLTSRGAYSQTAGSEAKAAYSAAACQECTVSLHSPGVLPPFLGKRGLTGSQLLVQTLA